VKSSWKYAAFYIFFSIPLNFASKDLLSVAGPLFLTFARSAAVAALLIIMLKRIPRVDSFQIAMSLLIYASTVLWLMSLEVLSPGDSIVLGYSMPVIAIILGRLLYGERGRLWIALLSLSGFALYSVPLSTGSSLSGVFLSFTNAFLWAFYSVLYKRKPGADPVEFNAGIFLAMSAVSLPFALLEKPPAIALFQLMHVLELIWLATAGGALQFISWNRLIVEEGIERATMISYLVPIGVLTIQSASYGKAPEAIQILGLSIALLGVFLPSIAGKLPHDRFKR